MKRILITISLIIVSLFGAITFHISSQSTFDSKQSLSLPHQTTEKQNNNHQSQLLSLQISSISGEENVLVHFGFNFQEKPTRINSSSEYAARIRNFKQLIFQKYYCSSKVITFRQAVCQFNGYYIYHLRKLLI